MMRRTVFVVLSLVLISPALSQAASLVGGDGIYFGHLHNHTSFSDGAGTPEQAYSTARTAGLDFFGLSDHDDALTPDEFADTKTAADAANVPGEFSTFWGFEWSSSQYGHITVVNPGEFTTSSNTATDTFSEFMSWLSAQGAIAFFNHPGRQDAGGTEFDHFTGAYSGGIVGMELWNKTDSFGTYYYNGGYTSDSRDRSGYYDEALLNGWSIGASGSEDHHGTDWGSGSYRLAVLSGSNTRDAIYSALNSRRFYSTLDRNLELSFQVDGSEMGSSVPGGWNQCVVKAADRDDESFSKVEIIQNGYIVHTENVSGTLPVATCNLFTQENDSVYCKVTQSDGDEAISSPVFITSDGPDGPPRADLAAPLDNGSADFEPANDSVVVNTTQPVFQIQLVDFEGINDATVTSGTVSIANLTLNQHYTFAYDSDANMITLAPPVTGGAFGNGAYTITLSGISDLASPANTMAATTFTIRIDTSIVLPSEISFQSSVDTMIREAAPGTSYSGASTLTVDTDDNSTWLASQVLMRFDGIIGTAGDQIPPYATINSATLRLWSLDTGNGGTLYAMLQDWSDAATWDSLLGGDGIQEGGVEALGSADDGVSSTSVGYVNLNVTGTVQNWADGVFSNYGWVLLPNGADGWDIASAEYSMVDYRPKLVVTYTPSEASGNRSPIADAGTDQTVNDDDEDGCETVTLSGSASRDLDGYVDTYAWTEGEIALGNTQTVSWCFPVGTHAVTLTVRDDDGATDTDTVVITVTEAMTLEDCAVGETPVEGSVAGDYQATWSRGDGVVEVIREAISGNNKNLVRSSLEHIWRFDVTGGDTITMHLAATVQLVVGSPDQFVFAYSTDGLSYTDIATVAGLVEGDYALPNTIRGVLYVRVSDTNSDKLDPTVDSVSVDCINIRSAGTGVPDSEPPSAPTGLVAASSDSSVQLSWNANSESDLAGYYVYRRTSSGGDAIACNGLVAGTAFVDSGLAAGTYYYVVQAVDLSGNRGDFSNEVSVTVVETPVEEYNISVSSIAVVVNVAKKYSATATVIVTPDLGDAVVTGDWYFKGAVLRQSSASGTTNADGVTTITTPFETPAKSGDVFTFVVTNVTLEGYTYNPPTMTQDSDFVP